MKLQDLQKWGIPPRIIEAWSKRQGDRLLPIQNRAVRRGLLRRPIDDSSDESFRFVISAPTASGKSFCAELAMAQALLNRQKTVLLFPLKSLAEQKYRSFMSTYGPLGVKCLIASGDHPENDTAFSQGDYQVAVAIYEKFDLLLTANLDALSNIGLVVIDEIQTVGEPGRGAVLERLLTKILASVYVPSLVALSAVIADKDSAAGRLADWLGAVLIQETTRPLDLFRGVAAEGSFRYRSFNDEVDGSEPFQTAQAGEDNFDSFVRQLKSCSASTLVFLKSRRETVENAFRLAASVNWPPATQALEALAEEEPSFLIRTLRQTLSRGVAFHNADLSQKQRFIIEEAFTNKTIMVIFSTTTLAMGVDLPADTVYLETLKYAQGAYDDRPVLVPVSRAEFSNMTGRAGRLGRGDNKPGRAIMLADSDFDRDVLWDNYIAFDTSQSIESVLGCSQIGDWLLNMIVSGLIGDLSDLRSVLPQTLWARTQSETHSIESLIEWHFEPALRSLVEKHFVEVNNEEKFAPTPIGRAAAITGLSIAQASHFTRAISGVLPQTPDGWTALALSAPDWSLPPGILTRYELAQNRIVKELYRKYDNLIEDIRFLIEETNLRQPLHFKTAGRLKSLLVLREWRRGTPVQQLEEQFQIHLGQIMTLGENAAHLVVGMARLIEATEYESPVKETLGALAFGLRFGLPAELHDLRRTFGDALVRSDYVTLQEAGLRDLSSLCASSPEELAGIMGNSNKHKNFNEILTNLRQEVDMQPGTRTMSEARKVGPALTTKPESIVVDGSLDGERYLIRINGFPVLLTGKSFKYFVKLAWSRLNRESGWIYKEDIEQGFNQARYLYRMKNEIASGLDMGWPVFENNRLGYYRLNADPSRISLDIDNLRKHPDFELRSMIAEGTGETVN